MLTFYGFEECEIHGEYAIVASPNAASQQRNRLTEGNHNFLRITRILTSLRTLGLPEKAQAFFAALSTLYESKGAVIGTTTYRFWREAVSE